MFIRPEQHTLPDGLQAVSGSDANGGCAMECVQIDRCQCPDGVAINSALIDGVCPASVDTTDPEYARYFFTVSRNGDDSVLIGFQWDNRFILGGVKLKLFNCETLFTGIYTINVWRSIIFPSFSTMSVTLVGSYVSNENDISCNNVTTIVIPTNTTSSSNNYFIEFTFPPGDSNTGVYIAEAQFSDTTIVVPQAISSSLTLSTIFSTPQQQTILVYSTLLQQISSTPLPTSQQQIQTPSFHIRSPSTVTTLRISPTLLSTPKGQISIIPTSTTSTIATESTPMYQTSIPSTHTTPTKVTILTDTFTKPSPTQSAGLPGNQGVDLSIVIGLLVSVIAILTLITIIVTILWCRQKIKTREFTPERRNDLNNDPGSIELRENQAYGHIDHGETVDTDPNPAYNSAHPPSSKLSTEYDYISDIFQGNQSTGNDSNGKLASVVYEEIPS